MLSRMNNNKSKGRGGGGERERERERGGGQIPLQFVISLCCRFGAEDTS